MQIASTVGRALPRSLQSLLRRPAFAATAVLFMGLGIGVNTTMYSLLDALIHPNTDIVDAHQLYRLSATVRKDRVQPGDVHAALRAASYLHDGITTDQPYYIPLLVEGGRSAAQAQAVTVGPEYFAVMGVHASAGRLLSPVDVHSVPPAAVIGERMAAELFAGLESPIGQTIRVNGTAFSVIGVLPSSADVPRRRGDVWVLPADSVAAASVPLNLIRLRAGSTREQTLQQLEALGRRFDTPVGPGVSFRLYPLIEGQFTYHNFHTALIAAVLAVLLVACANIANLQLARGIARQRELATRAALGASRGTLISQLLMESAWLALGGLVLGILVTLLGVHVLTATIPPSIGDYIVAPQLSWRVFAFALGVSAVCVALVGLAPALRVSRFDLNAMLKAGAGTGVTREGRRQWGTLVSVEVGLALALLCGAALLMRAASALYPTELTAEMPVAKGIFRYADPVSGRKHTARDVSSFIVNRLERDPGVAVAAVQRPRSYPGRALTIADPGGQLVEILAPLETYSLVTPSFFRTLGIRPTTGRDFLPGVASEPEAIVDDRTARMLWPGADPIGQRIQLGSRDSGEPWVRVVGVIPQVIGVSRSLDSDVRQRLREPAPVVLPTRSVNGTNEVMTLQNPRVFVLNASDTAVARQGDWGFVLARSRGPADRLPVTVMRSLGAQSDVTLMYVQSWDQSTGLERARTSRDFVAALFGAFAAIALALASFGVYAVVAHAAAQRTREIGVRIALGAARRDVLRMMLRESNILAMWGVAVGLLFTKYSAGLLERFLWFEDDVNDAGLFALVALILFAVVTVASLIPALRATRVNPVEALRND